MTRFLWLVFVDTNYNIGTVKHYSMFPDEPIGGEAAIIWHLEQIDHYEWQATEADACDMADVCEWYDKCAGRHRVRLKVLEDQFPETAKSARAYMQAKYREQSIRQNREQ